MKTAAPRRLGWWALAGALIVGCGAVTSPTLPDSGVAPDTSATACPALAPTSSSGCTRDGVVCEYGDDPRVQCRTFATCSGARWSVTAGTCDPLPPASCPATREAASGQACAVEGAYCAYAGLPCECTNCIRYPIERCDGPRTWRCDAPSTILSCPAARPRAGTPCATESLACYYGCEPGRSRRCAGGLWTPSDSPGGCPISTRAAKRNIAYVAPTEADALAREVLSTRLATYEYTDPLLAGRRRLGFILEDQPAASYAREPDRSAVDLYGYTSMLVATVQAQDRRIRALESSIAAMRRTNPGHGIGHAD